jgi:hypothetical protein
MEEMQAKELKRREAAAKRERAMAYALTHQVFFFFLPFWWVHLLCCEEVYELQADQNFLSELAQ